ncbi:hypothetical protein LIER_34066 [Lithospermum erythrorhizon]|uniref:Uncharacterized protein n=1 Tax=Lithospermum erythrorhizon TaxID=34254 RepID=A0AAV3RYE3_LITER
MGVGHLADGEPSDAVGMRDVNLRKTIGVDVVAQGQNIGTLYKDATGFMLDVSFGVSMRDQRRAERYSQALKNSLIEERCSDQTLKFNELIK